MERSHPIKLLLMGESGVGKTSIMIRYNHNSFDKKTNIATIGIDYVTKIVDVEGIKYKVAIWDTAGQEKFRAISMSFVRGTDGVILVYDITNRRSFERVSYWVDLIKKYAFHYMPYLIIIGNKCDLPDERQVSYTEGCELARMHDIKYFIETSAATNDGIEDVFDYIVRQVIAVSSRIVYPIENTVVLDATNSQARCCN